VAATEGRPRFLSALPPAHAEALLALGRPRRYAEGAALFHERQPGDRVLVLLSGRVKLCSLSSDREVILGIREPGDLLGEMSVLDGRPRGASAIALEPVEARVIPAADFYGFLARTPAAGLALARLLSARLRDADIKRAEHLGKDSLGRVCARLVELCDRFGTAGGDEVAIDLAMNQEDLAAWTGSSREAATKALRTLRELGLIRTGRRTITVLDPVALRRRAL